jgi:hypothetical protein
VSLEEWSCPLHRLLGRVSHLQLSRLVAQKSYVGNLPHFSGIVRIYEHAVGIL